MECIVNWINNNVGVMTALYTLSTLVIIYQSFRQKQVVIQNQKENLKVQLYEKRFNVYNKLRNAISNSLMLQRQELETSFVEEFREIREEIALLFDEDIHDYALLVLSKAESLSNDQSEENKYAILVWAEEQVQQKKNAKQV